MLQFVSLSGQADGKDLQTRRKVRSQAMRDFRRRQRAEREATKARDLGLSASPPPRAARKADSTSTSDGSWQIRARSTSSTPSLSSVSGNRPRKGPKRSTYSPKPIVPSNADPFVTFQATSTPPASSAVTRTPSILFSNEFANDLVKSSCDSTQTTMVPAPPFKLQRAHSDSYGVARRSPAPAVRPDKIPSNPSTWGTATDDPFQSPAQIAQMFAFCKSYIHWLRPGVNPEAAGEVLTNAWETSPCPMLLAACCLASVGHLDAVQPNRPGGNYALYKARVLREVSDRMKSSITATSDETIGTLGCLLSFEMSRGSAEALTHLHGLRSIVNMKGGMGALAFTGISMMLETLDLLHTAIFDSYPVLTSPEPGTSTKMFGDLDISHRERVVELTPLLLISEQDQYHLHRTPYTEQLNAVPELIRAYVRAMADAVLVDGVAEQDAIGCRNVEDFRSKLENFGQTATQEHPDACDAHHLARACHLNYVILFNLIVNKYPQRHESNQKYADGLFTAVRCVAEKTWEGLSYLKLLILLTGAVSSSDVTRRSFFKAQLVRTIYSMGNGEWRRIKRFLLVYIDVKQKLERPERRASPPLDVPTTATADRSYLYANWPESRRSSSPQGGSATVDSSGMSHDSSHISPSLSPRSHSSSMFGPEHAPASLDVQSTEFADLNLDPFLRSHELSAEQSLDAEQCSFYPSVPEETLATDRIFNTSMYDGDFWFTNTNR